MPIPRLFVASLCAAVAIGACAVVASVDGADRRRDDRRAFAPVPEPASAIVGSRAPLAPPAPPPPPPPPGYSTLTDLELLGEGIGTVAVVPGKEIDRTKPPPIITALHCTCWAPDDMCEFMKSIADRRGVLVCPRGNGACSDGSPDWVGDNALRAKHAEAAVELAEHRLGEDDGTGRWDVLVGFSRGAFVARDLVYASHDRWKGLVLIGAAITPDAKKLKAAGIERVLLTAPDKDGAAPTMRGAASSLAAAGIPTRFVRLGPGYHGMPENGPALLQDGMDWVTGH